RAACGLFMQALVAFVLLGCESQKSSVPSGGTTTPLIIKTIVGLLTILTLAWLGAHPRIRKVEELLGVRQVITAGFPFVALGVLGRHPAIGVLTDSVLEELTPILQFALGWLGFLMGFQFDVRVLDRLPKGTARRITLRTSLPFVVLAAMGCLTMLAFGQAWGKALVRDAVSLATAGALTSPRLAGSPPPWDPANPERGLLARIEQLDDIAGVAGLAFLSAFFRPEDKVFTWNLPGSLWLFITLGMGASIGLLVYVFVRLHAAGAEFFAITFGSVAFCAGMAGYLWLSPIAVCFVAGALLANLPGEKKERLAAILTKAERPIYFLFLTVAGALWDFTDWRGWALLPVFLVSRWFGSWLAHGVFFERLAAEEEVPVPLVMPVSAVSIAIVVNMQSLYHGPAVAWIVTAVLAG